MSRSYYHRSASSDESAGFILLILLAGTVYAHRAVMIVKFSVKIQGHLRRHLQGHFVAEHGIIRVYERLFTGL